MLVDGEKQPHFSVGHFCGGCEVSNNLHTGCVTESNVRIVKTSIPHAQDKHLDTALLRDLDSNQDNILQRDVSYR